MKAALAGLDQEQPGDRFFGAPLKKAVQDGLVPQARLDDMVHRIVRSMFATGVVDHPPVRRVVDPFKGRDDGAKIEEESIVLLKNEDGILPLGVGSLKSIAIIGGHADEGVLSRRVGAGGCAGWAAGWIAMGCAGVLSVVAAAVCEGAGMERCEGELRCGHGRCAGSEDCCWSGGGDRVCDAVDERGNGSPTLSLPENQDALVVAVAKANPNTVVVLETGGPVSMPWHKQVKGIVEAWYPGIGGGGAIADVLFGRVNASGKLPVTFAADDAQLPHPKVTGLTATTENNGMNGGGFHGMQSKNFAVDYNVEGMKVGYKWFQVKDETPLFPFGFGLSYTSFAYSGLTVAPDAESVSFEVKNTGARAGDEVAEVYVTLPKSADEPFRKLVGFARVWVDAGASKTVTVPISAAVSQGVLDGEEWLGTAGGTVWD